MALMTWLVESVFSILSTLHLAPPVPSPYPDRLAPLDSSSSNLDNEIYNNSSFDWSKSGLSLLNPVRVNYFLDKLERYTSSSSHPTITILDLGCGSGLAIQAIHDALVKDGRQYKFIGLDMSSRSIDLARQHAKSEGMNIEYVVGDIYSLPFSSSSIDGIICSDVLEHLFNLPLAFSEISRVLKPGGFFTFDTINRTPASYYLTIWILQDILKAMQGDAHDHRLYVTPQEVHRCMEGAGLRVGPRADLVGMRPGINWPHVGVRRLYKGQGFVMSVLGEFKVTKRDLGVSWLHWCEKPQS